MGESEVDGVEVVDDASQAVAAPAFLDVVLESVCSALRMSDRTDWRGRGRSDGTEGGVP